METKIKYYFMCRLFANEKPSMVIIELKNLLASHLVPNELDFKTWENEFNYKKYVCSTKWTEFYTLTRNRLGVPVNRILSELRTIFGRNAPSSGILNTWIANQSNSAEDLFKPELNIDEINLIKKEHTVLTEQFESLKNLLSQKIGKKIETYDDLEQIALNLVSENSSLKVKQAKLELALKESQTNLEAHKKEAYNEKKSLSNDYEKRIIGLNLQIDELNELKNFYEEKTKSQATEISDLKYKLICRNALEHNRQSLYDSIVNQNKENNSNNQNLFKFNIKTELIE